MLPPSPHSFLDIVLGELLTCTAAVLASTSTTASAASASQGAAARACSLHLTATFLAAPYTAAFSPQGSARALARLHDAFCTVLMASARRSGAVRALLLTRGVPGALAQPLVQRLAGCRSSASAASALPLLAVAAQLRLLAALACPGDSSACSGVARGEGVLGAAAAALALRRPPLTPASALTIGALNDARVAAATLLANLATRKGNDTHWSARPELLGACLAGLRDECVGVRAACAACIAGLLRNSVRVRATPGLRGVLVAAAGENGALLLRARAGLGEAAAVLSCAAAWGGSGWCSGSGGGQEEQARQIRDAVAMLANAVQACNQALELVKA